MMTMRFRTLLAGVAMTSTGLFVAACELVHEEHHAAPTATLAHTAAGLAPTAPYTSDRTADAAFSRGVSLQFGVGQPVDLAKAAEWYTKAANAGHLSAMKNLAALYYDGSGVERDYQEALSLYQRAADAGDVGAVNSLAGMYFDGKGVPQDFQQSARLYRRAAELDYPYAQTSLGLMYRFGHGVERDLLEAYAWWTLAAKNGDRFATQHLQELEQELSADDRERARVRSVELGRAIVRAALPTSYTQSAATMTPTAPHASDLEADTAFSHGVRFHFGIGQAVDLEKAVEWYTIAADAGHLGAMSNLAALYFDGRGIEPEYEKALRLYQRAADGGDLGAMTSLAGMYLAGKGVPQDARQSLRLYRQAAEQDYPYAQAALGSMYRFGWGVDVDLLEAYAWWIVASKNGDNFAAHNLTKLETELDAEDREKARLRSLELGKAITRANR